MTKNKVNKLRRRGRNVEEIEAEGLDVPGELLDWKLQLSDRPGKLIIAYRDMDGKKLVVDGRHAATRAKRRGDKVSVVFVDEDEVLGNQTVLERLLGMLSGGKVNHL